MIETVITIRNAREGDAEGIADVHDAAWRDAYRGLIPGRELERMIARRGPRWWHSAIIRGSRLLVLDFDETIGGYHKLWTQSRAFIALWRRDFRALYRA